MNVHKVLIVEDEASLRKLYRLELQDAGYEVETAADVAGALELATAWQPDVAVLDIRLGGDSGLDILRHLVANQPRVRTVLLSGYAGYRDDFSTWLADAFLIKSGDLAPLVRVVGDLVAQAPLYQPA